MEKTFQLPNEVSCSDGVESETAHNAHNAENRTKITTSEYKKVAALSTSSISRPSKVTPDKIEGDERVAVDASTLAKQATALRRLKWISALLAISTVINSATFGGLTHSLVCICFQYSRTNRILIIDKSKKQLEPKSSPHPPPSKPKREITNITDSQNTRRTYGQPSEQLFPIR